MRMESAFSRKLMSHAQAIPIMRPHVEQYLTRDEGFEGALLPEDVEFSGGEWFTKVVLPHAPPARGRSSRAARATAG